MGAIASVISRRADIICCTGADVNAQNSDGNTALHLAVLESNDLNHVKTLIYAGTDVNIQNSDRNTALHLAVLESKDLHHVKTLIDAGANVNIQNSDRNTALHLGVLESNDVSTVKTLIDAGTDVNTQNSDRNTALHLAVLKSKDLSHVKTLTDAGADVNIQKSDGNTAPHLAVLKSKDLSHVKTLIDAGADVNIQKSDGNTALHLCLLNTKRFSLARFDSLVDENASGRIAKSLQNKTITVNAYLLEDYDIAETLIDEGADLNIQNNDGNTPLHLALIHSKTSKLVHESNNKWDHCPEDVNVCKLASQESCMYKLVKKMIDKGANVDKQNNKGNTVFHLALSSQLQLAEAVYEMFERDVNSYFGLLAPYYHSRSIPYHKVVNDHFEKFLYLLLIKSETIIYSKKKSKIIYIRNRLGTDPIQMTIDLIKRKPRYEQMFSVVMTFAPLLNLEYHEHFTYSDCYGNTLLHLLIEEYEYNAFLILKSVDPTYLKFNVQNKAGNTPLHIATHYAIVYALSNCDKVDLFAKNTKNETFLHMIFKLGNIDNIYIQTILEGQCKYFSKEDVKQLLCCKDIAGNTPLHVFITNEPMVFISLIQLFYETGADMNACNIYNESILHCLVRESASEEIIKFAIEHGAEVNVQNVFGESPIFVARADGLKFLIGSGADLKICNKTGQNPLLSVLMHTHLFDIPVECLIQNSNLKVKDIHGNNILHYAAWHGMYRFGKEYCDNVTLLLGAGAEIEPDALGQLPCYIAHQMGHVKLARKLCKCDNTEHLDKFTFTRQEIYFEMYETLNLRNHKFFLHQQCAKHTEEPQTLTSRFGRS